MRVPRTIVRFVAEGAEAVGRLTDVSRSGLYVRAQDLPRPGSIVALQFQSPAGKLVDVRGQVRWSSRDSTEPGTRDGFGVRLTEPPREYLDFVSWVRSREEKPEEP